MEKRKVQKSGRATYAVNLPKSWIVRNSIGSGDEISIIEETDGNLTICPDAVRDPLRYAIKIDGQTRIEDIILKFTSLYLKQYDLITIEPITKLSCTQYIDMRNELEKLMGFEIVEEDENIITADNTPPAIISRIKSGTESPTKYASVLAEVPK